MTEAVNGSLFGGGSRTVALCGNCQHRPGTMTWVGEGGAITLVHGAYSLWCEQCVIETQLAYARQQAARVPDLETKLAELLNEGR